MRRRHHLLMFCLMAFVSLLASQAALATSPPVGSPPASEDTARPATTSPGRGTQGTLVANPAPDAAAAPRTARAAGEKPVLGGAADPVKVDKDDQCTGLDNVNPVCQAKEEATEAVAGAGESAMKSIATSFSSGTVYILDKINSDLAQKADPAFSGKNGAWFNKQYGTMFALALVVMTILAFISFGGAAIRGDQAAIASTVGYMLAACILTASATAIVTLALQFTDAFTDVVAKDFKKNTADMFTNLSASYESSVKGASAAIGKLVIAMLLSIVTIVGSMIVFLILLLRGALLYAVVLFLPFLFASMVWGGSRSMVATGIKWMTMLILCKFVMFALLAAGAGAMSSVVSPPPAKAKAVATTKAAPDGANAKAASTQKATAEDDSFLATAVFGAGAIWLAAFSPYLLLSVLPMSAQAGASQAAARGGSIAGKGAGKIVGGVKGSMATAQRAGSSIAGGVGSRIGAAGGGRASAAGAPRPSMGGTGSSASSAGGGGLASPTATAARAGIATGGSAASAAAGSAAGSAAGAYAASATAPASAGAATTGAAITAATASVAASRPSASAPTSAPHVISARESAAPTATGSGGAQSAALASTARGASPERGSSPAADAALAAYGGATSSTPLRATPARGVQPNKNLIVPSNRISGSNVIKGV